jgi:NAD(P)-dependent dehydrogenase (short-subunit alcohol dehydrogenase family)
MTSNPLPPGDRRPGTVGLSAGADVAILYKDEHEDAAETRRHIEAEGRRCEAIAGDVGDPDFCQGAVEKAVRALGGRLDILVNNAAEQHVCEDFAEIPVAQVERTFRTNILGYFWVTRAALPPPLSTSRRNSSSRRTSASGRRSLAPSRWSRRIICSRSSSSS